MGVRPLETPSNGLERAQGPKHRAHGANLLFEMVER